MRGCRVIGFVGSIFPYHGVDLLIEAFAGLDENPDLRLLIVGDGSTLPELKSLAKRLGVLNRCIFTGSVPHRRVYAFMEVMDICCMARSNSYGSPVKIFEYGLLKKPVVAPDTVPVRDVMIHGEDAILVEPNVQSILDALQELLDDHTLALKMAGSWHEKVLLNHTWDNAAKTLIEACT